MYLIGCVLWREKGVAIFILLQQSDGSSWGLQSAHTETLLTHMEI